MNPSTDRQSREKIFTWILLGCMLLAAGYFLWALQRPQAGLDNTQSAAPMTLPPASPPNDLKTVQGQTHLVVINRERPYIGQVKLIGLDLNSPKSAQTALACDRVHYAGGHGICLTRDLYASSDGVRVTLFGSDFTPHHEFTVEGFPSRTRVSPDGRYAAFTVFVTGHSYNDANMSTATVLVDTASGTTLGNLEEFETWKDGERYQAPHFNFWGVTFAKDSNQFYATLRQGDRTYLVQGDLAARNLTVLRDNVECPSLSPDGTRIAFKKRTLTGEWQLTILDLATMKETPLAEPKSIDDQVEWLDNNHILYESFEHAPPLPWLNVMVVPADGTGQPKLFATNAISPSVVP